MMLGGLAAMLGSICVRRHGARSAFAEGGPFARLADGSGGLVNRGLEAASSGVLRRAAQLAYRWVAACWPTCR